MATATLPRPQVSTRAAARFAWCCPWLLPARRPLGRGRARDRVRRRLRQQLAAPATATSTPCTIRGSQPSSSSPIASPQPSPRASCSPLPSWTFRVTPAGDRARRRAIWTLVFAGHRSAAGSRSGPPSLGGTEQLHRTGHRAGCPLYQYPAADGCLDAHRLVLTPAGAAFLHATRNRRPPHFKELIAWLSVAATILIGATGALAALADTLFPSPTLAAGLAQDFQAHAPVLIRMRWLHPAAAVVDFVVCCGWYALQYVPKAPGTSYPAPWSFCLASSSFSASPMSCFSLPSGCRSSISSALTSTGRSGDPDRRHTVARTCRIEGCMT